MARDAVNAQAEIAKLRFQLARYRRAEFGQSSEKLEREADQLELAIETLEADQAERLAVPRQWWPRRSKRRSTVRSRRAGLCPTTCRARTGSMPRRTPARAAAVRCAGSVRTSPRRSIT